MNWLPLLRNPYLNQSIQYHLQKQMTQDPFKANSCLQKRLSPFMEIPNNAENIAFNQEQSPSFKKVKLTPTVENSTKIEYQSQSQLPKQEIKIEQQDKIITVSKTVVKTRINKPRRKKKDWNEELRLQAYWRALETQEITACLGRKDVPTRHQDSSELFLNSLYLELGAENKISSFSNSLNTFNSTPDPGLNWNYGMAAPLSMQFQGPNDKVKEEYSKIKQECSIQENEYIVKNEYFPVKTTGTITINVKTESTISNESKSECLIPSRLTRNSNNEFFL